LDNNSGIWYCYNRWLEQKVSAGESIKINKKAKHRIFNIGDIPLVFIEVQTGTYFGEDDIIRIEDDYNRK
jgi:mannose-6-phosphate isomerase